MPPERRRIRCTISSRLAGHKTKSSTSLQVCASSRPSISFGRIAIDTLFADRSASSEKRSNASVHWLGEIPTIRSARDAATRSARAALQASSDHSYCPSLGSRSTISRLRGNGRSQMKSTWCRTFESSRRNLSSSCDLGRRFVSLRSEEHTSELQSLRHLVCRLLLEKKKL